MVGCPSSKTFLTYATLEIIMFHCEWCPIGTLSIMVGCTSFFYLLQCLMFWYNVRWGFHNISIVHGKHTDVGCTMVGLCGNLVPIFLFAWHVLKAWRLCSMEKIKDLKVRRAVLDYFHTVMFMSINSYETIDDFKACGREMVVESFDNLQPCVAYQGCRV